MAINCDTYPYTVEKLNYCFRPGGTLTSTSALNYKAKFVISTNDPTVSCSIDMDHSIELHENGATMKIKCSNGRTFRVYMPETRTRND